MRFVLLLLCLFAAPLVAEDEGTDPAYDAANTLLSQKKYSEALAQYKKLIEKTPKAPGLLYNAGMAAFFGKEYPLAAQYFKTLKSIDAADVQARAKLIQTYQAAGDDAARDAERAELLKLRKESKDLEWLQRNFYCRDQFEAAGKRVMVFEYFELLGDRAQRYAFRVLNAEGKEDHYVSLGSYEMTNAIAHQTGEIKKDERLFHLDGYYRGEKDHATFAFFTNEPAYDEVKKAVVEILENKRKPMSATRGPQ